MVQPSREQREVQIAEDLAAGKDPAQIARETGVSVAVVLLVEEKIGAGVTRLPAAPPRQPECAPDFRSLHVSARAAKERARWEKMRADRELTRAQVAVRPERASLDARLAAYLCNPEKAAKREKREALRVVRREPADRTGENFVAADYMRKTGSTQGRETPAIPEHDDHGPEYPQGTLATEQDRVRHARLLPW